MPGRALPEHAQQKGGKQRSIDESEDELQEVHDVVEVGRGIGGGHRKGDPENRRHSPHPKIMLIAGVLVKIIVTKAGVDRQPRRELPAVLTIHRAIPSRVVSAGDIGKCRAAHLAGQVVGNAKPCVRDGIGTHGSRAEIILLATGHRRLLGGETDMFEVNTELQQVFAHDLADVVHKLKLHSGIHRRRRTPGSQIRRCRRC